MKRVFIILVLLVCGIGTVFGQVNYTSNDNYSGAWENNNSWTRTASWAAESPGNPPQTIVDVISVYGYLTINGGFSTTHDVVLDVYDTLVVDGDILLSGGADINVKEKGLLIILGDYESGGDVDVVNEGNIVVTGNFKSTGGATLDNQGSGAFYLYGTPELVSGGDASVDGCYAYPYSIGECDISGSFKSKTDLQNDYPPIYDFIENNTPLPQPVTLLYFTTTAQFNSVAINWASSKAWDFSHYELERSANGKDFSKIANIDAAENSDLTETYAYTDHQPLSGISYYRLKAVDVDGTFEYKGIELVKFGTESFKVYPNPSTIGEIYVDWSHADEQLNAVLKDNSGRTVRTALLEGSDKSLSTAGLPAGLYLLSVQSPAGTQQAQVMIR